jgi:hypothetical protein
MTPRSTGLVTFAGLFVAAGFAVFFFAVKHQPWLASVAPFGEDPYDSVGSFAVQLAGVAASIAVLRVLARASGAPRVPLNSTSLCLRAVIITLLAIFITAVADLVALLRYPNSWWHSSIGKGLALTLALVLVTVVVGVGRLLSSARETGGNYSSSRWFAAAAVTAVVAFSLWIYPEAWHRSIAGAVITAVFGMGVMFAAVWSLAVLILPGEVSDDHDVLDDLSALWEWVPLGRAETRARRRSCCQNVAQWLRAHRALSVVLVATAIGLGLMLVEVLGEGLPEATSRRLLVVGVFTGVEALGVVLGYALFLGLLSLSTPSDRASVFPERRGDDI